MVIMVKFNNAHAQCLMRCLASGNLIRSEREGWSGNAMLALAGACSFGAAIHGN